MNSRENSTQRSAPRGEARQGPAVGGAGLGRRRDSSGRRGGWTRRFLHGSSRRGGRAEAARPPPPDGPAFLPGSILNLRPAAAATPCTVLGNARGARRSPAQLHSTRRPRRPRPSPTAPARVPRGLPARPPRRDHPAPRPARASARPSRALRSRAPLTTRSPSRARSNGHSRAGRAWGTAATLGAHVPRGHGDVVEGEPGGGRPAQPPSMAGGLPLLAGLRGAAVAAVLLAERHGGRAAGGTGREGQGSGRGPRRARSRSAAARRRRLGQAPHVPRAGGSAPPARPLAGGGAGAPGQHPARPAPGLVSARGGTRSPRPQRGSDSRGKPVRLARRADLRSQRRPATVYPATCASRARSGGTHGRENSASPASPTVASARGGRCAGVSPPDTFLRALGGGLSTSPRFTFTGLWGMDGGDT